MSDHGLVVAMAQPIIQYITLLFCFHCHMTHYDWKRARGSRVITPILLEFKSPRSGGPDLVLEKSVMSTNRLGPPGPRSVIYYLFYARIPFLRVHGWFSDMLNLEWVVMCRHNTYHYLEFFRAIRHAIKVDKFLDFRNWFTSRREESGVPSPTKGS